MRVHSPMVIHYVRDMEHACAFYRDALGLPEEATPGSGSSGWNTFRCDGLILALHILPDGESAEGPLPHAGLNLEVDDLDTALASCRQRAACSAACTRREVASPSASPRLPIRTATASSYASASPDAGDGRVSYPARRRSATACSKRLATPLS